MLKSSHVILRLILAVACLLTVAVAGGCKDVVIDPSPPAMAAGDFTLVFTAGQNTIRQGIDVFRATEGDPVSGELQIIAPAMPDLVAGELSVRYKTERVVKGFIGRVIRVPWAELIKHPTFELDDDGVVQLTGKAQWNAEDGPRWVDVQGFAFLIVHRRGYSPLPLNSGLEAVKQTCDLDYSTAGRSVVQCKNR